MGQGRGPEIGEVSDFGSSWWAWWESLQPAWRNRDVENPSRFRRDAYPKGTSGEWETLRHPGQNGVLSLVASLYWWGKRLSPESDVKIRESWEEAVADVQWMIQGLRRAEFIAVESEIESDELRSE